LLASWSVGELVIGVLVVSELVYQRVVQLPDSEFLFIEMGMLKLYD